MEILLQKAGYKEHKYYNSIFVKPMYVYLKEHKKRMYTIQLKCLSLWRWIVLFSSFAYLHLFLNNKYDFCIKERKLILKYRVFCKYMNLTSFSLDFSSQGGAMAYS